MNCNNAYCQDNRISWLDWDKLSENRGAHAAQSDAAHCTVSGYGMRSSVNKQQYSTKIEGVTLLCLSEVYTNK